jgi:tRNA (guanine37-N1)-methyltransferase
MDFIRMAADLVQESSVKGECAVIAAKRPRNAKPGTMLPEPKRVPIPPTISHFVMNLPASAINFLHRYRGVYANNEELFAPFTATKLPMVHVHCFSLKSDDNIPIDDICQRIYDEIGVRLQPGDANIDGQVLIHNVRDVAPTKRMFCASFRLPPEVAFASRD